MKARFDLRAPVPWTEGWLAEGHWSLLPLGTQPMVVTWIQCAVAGGVKTIEVLGAPAEVWDFLGDGERWGCDLYFKSSGETMDVDVDRPAFLDVDGGRIRVRPLVGLMDWFLLNRRLLRGESRLPVRPGYSVVVGEWVGLEPRLAPSCQCHAPVMLGDFVRLGALSEVGPETIVGERCVIGRAARVVGSVVLPHTYVGEGLSLEGRVAAGNKLVDPEDGTWVEVDELLLFDLRRSRGAGWWQRLRRALA